MGVRGKERAGTIEDVYPYKDNGIILYNAGSEIAKGTVVTIGYASTALKQVQAVANANVVFPIRTAIATEIVGASKFGVFVTGGIVDVLVEGTVAVAIGDNLQAVASQIYLVKDGTSRNAESVGVALAAQDSGAGNVLTSVFVIDEQHLITA